MDILFLLIPLSVGLALLIIVALAWAVWRGQFDSVEAEGERILRSD
ncbi:MAG: cbb3-type cytochrome oxidase assembly protein CcoS [Pseudomonadota bacterium]|jgi:cbb3-type cytochrome oxidase maturation protein|nr:MULTISPECIES: cbb3-type cytochrome oxidase assembly protein CcoS [unclassified Polaromonas]MDI1273320.1 cbb3-type cytochrome oxidase assembly protein CcoS [Polaromonas sp.]MDO8371204.1 cbb3-type cytochrome oxidase assembly protein CcoS [Polaromonas sp.]MDO8374254.1 cbb3-type cytochrome oxidase assembly protein CcoS [Polaromonas sp.]MDO9259658.1 cbb3-type cytochrome oxidase assembly protein CcoS [Polaromonas sp.]OYY38052.1 MAG: cytochrome oxidase maturation protein, cbb3-type [Polaromonas sp